ncbi:DUF38 domain-containing protein [Caenorhabditis elegans]|uniref:DUF38 domain-containing protein n=1 Tax=Caenorhabditis elegans TaxID=6239 RepID=A4F334_CAEEL|nr:DUF38 domain-containing protein [Caenorhabditis elegans]CCD73939.1 DUF38 domain-containing protein [Caenorhabditis elegans]|eukprot:NP_001076654.1 F-box A protein [Caenorhabditis elegans]
MIEIGSKTHQNYGKSPTFLNMPLDVAQLVLEKLELEDLRVCRSLRTAVDTFATIRINDVDFQLDDHDINMYLDRIRINYTDSANGHSNVNYNEQKKETDEENFMDSAVKDLKIVLKHASRARIMNCTKNIRDTVTTFVEFFKSEKCIHVKRIELDKFSLDEVLTILPLFDSKELKAIDLKSIAIDQFERISCLEQWKNAEICTIRYSIFGAKIAHFFHFKSFYIYTLDKFKAIQTAIQIRDDLLRRSTFQWCVIRFLRPNANPIEIAKVFKPDYAGGKDFKIEYSNGTDKFDISLEWEWLVKYFELNVKRL